MTISDMLLFISYTLLNYSFILLADGMGTCDTYSLHLEHMQRCICFISYFMVCLKLEGTHPSIYTFRMMETVHFVIN